MASHDTGPKRPRLSLQTKTTSVTTSRSSRTAASFDPRDPTAFNTLSNVYFSTIERSAAQQSEPITAINTLQAFSISSPVEYSYKDPKQRVMTPYVANYPETPVTATSSSPPQPLEMRFPSTMTATPPLSAGTNEQSSSNAFSFSPADISARPPFRPSTTPVEPLPVQQRHTYTFQRQYHNHGKELPYPHPQTPIHSILRNSPLPPKTAIPPPSPRRQSLRLQEKAARKVAYNSPLTQEITTQKYTRSHVDLLLDDASASSPSMMNIAQPPSDVVDVAMAYTANEIQDGGQTPGPFEEMRRRVAGMGMPLSPAGPAGVRKRKRKDKKRRWVWTIGEDDDGESKASVAAGASSASSSSKTQPQQYSHQGSSTTSVNATHDAADDMATPMAPIPQITYLDETPTPSIESAESLDDDQSDEEMSDISSITTEEEEERGLTPSDFDGDLKTPTAPKRLHSSLSPPSSKKRDTPIPELAGQEGSVSREQTPAARTRDTPIPPEGL
jgi:hypothetical protein